VAGEWHTGEWHGDNKRFNSPPAHQPSILSLQGDRPIDWAALTSLAPDFAASDREIFRVPTNWQAVEGMISAKRQQLLAGDDAFGPRIAVFPPAPVSACISLGYHLTSRPRRSR